LIDKANEASLANEVNDAVKSNVANEADLADETNEVDMAFATNVVNKVDGPANKANDTVESNVANKADLAEEADKANLANKANKMLDDGITIVDLALYSLTKHSAIFAEVMGYFGIFDNQLGIPFGGNQIGSCSFEKQCINQLENSG
jgi:hypothetical protein